MSERGSVSVLMLAVTALLSLMLVASASVGTVVATRARASTAADAAALAAAVATHPDTGRGNPRIEAERMARANGAELVGCVCPIASHLELRVVTVLVAVRVELPVVGEVEVRASARAEFDPRRWLGR
jgi:secretion/DNA translocation related TadE-like protein